MSGAIGARGSAQTRPLPHGGAAQTATNILFAKRKIEREMAEDPVFAAEVAALKASLLANH